MARCRYCGKEVHKGKHQHEEYCPNNMNAKLESEKLKIKKSTGKVDEYENSEGQGDYLGTQLRDH